MSVSDLEFTPVVIVGAGRSGTNMLRDCLCRLDGMATWNCDEINPIWRHGNLDWPTDALPPGLATPGVRRYIRRAFVRVWRRSGRPAFVVEKTCANSLRVPFVDRVLPEARYIHLVRNGVDVVASAGRRWRGDLEMPALPYLLAKARYAPPSDLPRYAWATMRSRLGAPADRSGRLATWGPRFDGLDRLNQAPLDEVCARQWLACVQRAEEAFASLEDDKVLRVRYEDFVADPVAELAGILDFLGAASTEDERRVAVAPVTTASVGRGRQDADPSPAISALLEPTLSTYGYAVV